MHHSHHFTVIFALCLGAENGQKPSRKDFDKINISGLVVDSSYCNGFRAILKPWSTIAKFLLSHQNNSTAGPKSWNCISSTSLWWLDIVWPGALSFVCARLHRHHYKHGPGHPCNRPAQAINIIWLNTLPFVWYIYMYTYIITNIVGLAALPAPFHPTG